MESGTGVETAREPKIFRLDILKGNSLAGICAGDILDKRPMLSYEASRCRVVSVSDRFVEVIIDAGYSARSIFHSNKRKIRRRYFLNGNKEVVAEEDVGSYHEETDEYKNAMVESNKWGELPPLFERIAI